MKLEAEFGIVGAGPGGIALPVSQTDEASFEALSKRGVLMFEGGSEKAIGRGRLGDHNGIASNSLPSEFITLPEESPLRSSLNTDAGKLLKTYADDPEALSVPLAVVADFYHEVAQVLKEHWDQADGASRLFTDTKIVAAQQQEGPDSQAHWELITDGVIRFRVKNLILATGATAKPAPLNLPPSDVTLAEDIFNQSKITTVLKSYQAGKNIGIVGASHSGLLCLAQLLEELENKDIALRPNSIQVYTNGHEVRVFRSESEIERISPEGGFRVKSNGELLGPKEVCESSGRAFRYTGARGKAGEAGKRLLTEASNPQSPFQIVVERGAADQAQGHLVWAAGLQAEKIDLRDSKGDPIFPALSRGEYAVDRNGLLQRAEGGLISQAGAIGVAGGLLPEDGLGGEPLARELGVRLHSVNFYHQEVAQRLLKALS